MQHVVVVVACIKLKCCSWLESSSADFRAKHFVPMDVFYNFRGKQHDCEVQYMFHKVLRGGKSSDAMFHWVKGRKILNHSSLLFMFTILTLGCA